jgi:signal peptidase I
MSKYWQKKSIIIFMVLGFVAIAKPGSSDERPAPAVPIFSEAFCLKIFEEVAEKARSSTWKISDRDRHILTQCRAKFPAKTDAQIPLPTATECLDVVKTLIQSGLSKVKEIELPEDRVKSIERCDEVLNYYALPSENMLPTLKLNDKIVVDRTVYQHQLPQRGDIVVFTPAPATSAATPTTLIRRTIGLPREQVKIEDGKVYINGKLYLEDYLSKSATLQGSISVPANKYLVLDDNRNSLTNRSSWSLVPTESIVGKVIWHFGNK